MHIWNENNLKKHQNHKILLPISENKQASVKGFISTNKNNEQKGQVL